ncbi:hypothetical protein HFD88_002286 [Aspergillus terreus]|nr:hypothetical protein HFD88_002286 [Aspergillus terreus]
MTQWTEYLKEIPLDDLLRSVEASNPNTADPVEQGVLILYYTIVEIWQQKQTAVPWALQSADDKLEDLDKGYASGSTASSPAPSSIELDSSEEGFRSCPEFSYNRNRAVDYKQERPSRKASNKILSEGFGTPIHPVRSSPSIPRSETSPVRPGRTQSPDYSPWAGRMFQDQLERMVRRFLVRGSHGPMQTLLDWRDFRGFIHGLVETTRGLLDQLLLGAADQPPPAILPQKPRSSGPPLPFGFGGLPGEAERYLKRQHQLNCPTVARLRAQREAELQRSYETVSYQQLFPSRAGSHYIYIRFPHGRAPPPPRPTDAVEQGVLILYYTVIYIEAVRTQAGELPHQPLLAYMDANSVRKHVQPWQQMLGFFARTQHLQAW